jgi:O-antigen ligase
MVLIPVTRYRMASVIDDSLKSMKQSPEEIDQYQDMHRVYLWKSSLTIAKENIVFGYGLYGAKEELEKFYDQKGRAYFNSHSEYINSLLVFGISGLILSITSIYFLSISCFNKGNSAGFLFFLAIGMIMLTENCFNRFYGTSIYGCLAPIFYLKVNS